MQAKINQKASQNHFAQVYLFLMDFNHVSKKKPFYSINQPLRQYLNDYERLADIGVTYSDLMKSSSEIPVYDKLGKDTLWVTKLYEPSLMEELNAGLTRIYSLLKTGGDMHAIDHLFVERIDFCTFGNSKPFRMRIMNRLNDNYDYYYLKTADASRIYGLELEHILSPNRINYLVHENTLIEEHIVGIPGDDFILRRMNTEEFNKVRLSKEFIKFNERCFLRLLGDQRAYNFVIDVTPDFDEEQYRIRSIDFDQQCYEGRKNLYLPQFFKDNLPYVQVASETMTQKTVEQYKIEERVQTGKRVKASRHRLKALLDCMALDEISTPEKTDTLKQELAEYHQLDSFLACKNMGEVLALHLNLLLVNTKL